jgi:hypothetical protein
MLRVMGREDICIEIKLPSLNSMHISKVVENMLGGKVSPELIEMLSRESQGNPFVYSGVYTNALRAQKPRSGKR